MKDTNDQIKERSNTHLRRAELDRRQAKHLNHNDCDAYHITQWHPRYERSDTRKTNNMVWYAKSTKLIGLGIGRTMREPYPRNMTLLGLWNMIETLASQSAFEHRGWLVRDGQPLDADGMSSLIPSVPSSAFREALEWFSQPEINWLERRAFPPSESGASAQAGRNSATERQIEIIQTERITEREPHTDASRVPSLSEVRKWASEASVDPDFAELKFQQAIERTDFEKKAWLTGWQSKFRRFWNEDGADWRKKSNKKRAAGNGNVRPTGWEESDSDRWWTDPLADVRATLFGAVQAQNEKAAARLREIIALREKQ